MRFIEYKLGSLIKIKHGYAFSGRNITQEDNGIVLVTPGNFRIGGGFKEAKCKFFNGKIPSEYILDPRDIIVTMTDLSKKGDTLGFSARVPDSERTYLHNQRIGLIRVISEKCDIEYMYWLLRTYDYQRAIANNATGSTVKHTSPSKIYEHKVMIPDKSSQIKIAQILSTYDNLIENSLKQVDLLEELAHLLFKEWFVNLRFPDYEKIVIVDGIPKGWKLGILSDIATFKRGKTITRDTSINGLVPVVAGGMEPAYYHNKANAISPLVTISASGANAGFTRIYYEDIWASDCSVLDSSETRKLYFIYAFLINNKDQIKNLQRGAAQPHVYPKDINSLKILIPTEEYIQQYCSITESYFKKIACLSKIIKNSIEARDRLLPKLMQGEIIL